MCFTFWQVRATGNTIATRAIGNAVKAVPRSGVQFDVQAIEKMMRYRHRSPVPRLTSRDVRLPIGVASVPSDIPRMATARLVSLRP